MFRVNGKTVLLDCGMFQGRRNETRDKNLRLPVPVERIDAVVLSHTHIDYSGRLPLLTRHGYTGPIYCTAATRDLCAVMLADSAHIQEVEGGSNACSTQCVLRAYDSSRQILRLAGLSLVEASSGTHKGKERISKRGRPVLRRHVYIFALRCVRKGGLFREEFEAMVGRNGGIKIKALAAPSREVLKIMFTVAKERRPFIRVHVPAGRDVRASVIRTERA